MINSSNYLPSSRQMTTEERNLIPNSKIIWSSFDQKKMFLILYFRTAFFVIIYVPLIRMSQHNLILIENLWHLQKTVVIHPVWSIKSFKIRCYFLYDYSRLVMSSLSSNVFYGIELSFVNKFLVWKSLDSNTIWW